MKRINHLINTSFINNSPAYLAQITNVLKLLDQNVGFTFTSTEDNTWKQYLQRQYRSQMQENRKCATVSEPLKETKAYYDISTMNRYWMRITISQTTQAGILTKWQRYYAGLNLLLSKSRNQGYNVFQDSELIKLDKFSAVCYPWLVAVGIYQIVFILERWKLDKLLNLARKIPKRIGGIVPSVLHVVYLTLCRLLGHSREDMVARNWS